ncbi:hypothetical protein RHA1_ro00380 [Rhodococcus jostii RHA1]|uniref:Uncharacterized protein n=1 Tax=Rhodococcus jostii (strain RHA1) TaxID=101510 RepID=Q0SJS0_RHOJR|nr:hypothetical protein RHA1_ro00380 [Rhodococcus jostii RHA1]
MAPSRSVSHIQRCQYAMNRISSREYSMPGCDSLKCSWVFTTRSSSSLPVIAAPHGQLSLVFILTSVSLSAPLVRSDAHSTSATEKFGSASRNVVDVTSH